MVFFFFIFLFFFLSSTFQVFFPRNKLLGTNGTFNRRLHHVTFVESLRQIGFSGIRGSKGDQSYTSLCLGSCGTSKGSLDLPRFSPSQW